MGELIITDGVVADACGIIIAIANIVISVNIIGKIFFVFISNLSPFKIQKGRNGY